MMLPRNLKRRTGSLFYHCVRLWAQWPLWRSCMEGELFYLWIWCNQAPDSETLLMPVFSVPHVSDRLELHNNNWASGILHPGPSESDVYSDVIKEVQSKDLLHTVRLSVRLDTPLHGNNTRGTKYAVYYASVITHTVFENIKWLLSELCRNRNVAVPSLACLFPGAIIQRDLCKLSLPCVYRTIT